MFKSRELRKKNIAEYLLYMWQIEDLLRACDLSSDKIRECIVDSYDVSSEQREELLQWYMDLADMMRQEGVVRSGHLQINKNVIIMLADLHARLLKSSKTPFYPAVYYKALPFIVEFRSKSNGRDKSEIENCFDMIYMICMMRMQKRTVSDETSAAAEEVIKFITALAAYYHEDETGKLDLGDEEL